jgi:hypothetical protein
MVTRYSPLSPTMAQAIGFNDRRNFNAREGSAPTEGTLVPRGHSKVAIDPSEGTANARGQTLERSGARYRVHPLTGTVNQPYSAATQSTGRVVASHLASDYVGHGDYGGDEQDAFDDAAVIGGYGPGYHRVRGFTARG